MRSSRASSALNDELNAICFLDADGARRQRGRDRRRGRRGEDPGRLAGVPMGVKELAQVEGLPDTHASMLLQGRHRRPRLHRGGAAARRGRGDRRAHHRTGVRLDQLDAHLCTASRATRGTPSARPAARRADRRPRSRSACCRSARAATVAGRSASRRRTPACPASRRRSAASATRRPVRRRPHVGAGPMCRSGTRRGALRRRDRGPDAHRPDVAAPACPFVRGRSCRAMPRRGCAASGSRGRRRSATGCAIRRSRSVTHEAARRARPRRRARARRPRLPPPEGLAARGASCRSSTSPRATTTAARDSDERRRPVVAPASRDAERLTPDQLGLAEQRRCRRLLLAIADVFDEVDLLLTPTTATTAFAAEGVLPVEIDGQAVDLMGIGAVHRAVQHDRAARLSASRPAGVGRHAGRPAGRRPPPRGRPRARLRRGRSRPAAPGPSSPRLLRTTERSNRRESASRGPRELTPVRDRRGRRTRRRVTDAQPKATRPPQPGAGAGLRGGHRGRARRAAHAAADLDARPRAREHVRPRRRPRAHRRRPGPARPEVVEGA